MPKSLPAGRWWPLIKIYVSCLGEQCSPYENPIAVALSADKAFELLRKEYPSNWTPNGHNEWKDNGASLACVREFELPESEIVEALAKRGFSITPKLDNRP